MIFGLRTSVDGEGMDMRWGTRFDPKGKGDARLPSRTWLAYCEAWCIYVYVVSDLHAVLRAVDCVAGYTLGCMLGEKAASTHLFY